MSETIRGAGGPLLAVVTPFDVFADAQRLGAGKRSMAFSLEFRAPDRTLTDEEVNQVMDSIARAVTVDLQATIRES